MVSNNKVGIIVPNLFQNQLAYTVLCEANNFVSSDCTNDVALFFEDLSPQIIYPRCGIFNVSEIFHFDGTLISTTLQTTDSMLKTLKAKRKIFYIWSLEWLTISKNYIQNLSIFQDPQLELYTRSDSYAHEIHNYCGIRPKVVKQFKINEIL